jgi:tetratricopeptide (TPR) repeat protein
MLFLIYIIPLLADKEYIVRREAACAIGQFESPQAIQPLISALADKDYEVRMSVASALRMIASGGAANKEFNEAKVMEALIQSLDDENYNVREIIKDCLTMAHIEDKRGINAWEICTLRNIGCSLLNKGKYNDAAECFDAAIKLDSSNGNSWYHKGIALGSQAMYEDAIRCFDRAIELIPSYAEAWAARGFVLFMQRKDKRSPESFADKLLRSFASVQKFGYDEILSNIDKSIELKPSLAAAWYLRSEIFGNTANGQDYSKFYNLYQEQQYSASPENNCSYHLLLLNQLTPKILNQKINYLLNELRSS